MTKEKSEVKRVAVPAHIFENMLRGNLSDGAEAGGWKDDLLHWTYTNAQLDLLVEELTRRIEEKNEKDDAKEIINFIEAKIRNRKD